MQQERPAEKSTPIAEAQPDEAPGRRLAAALLRPSGPRSWIVLLIFCLALAVPYHEIWRAGVSNAIPTLPPADLDEPGKQPSTWMFLDLADAQWSAFSVSRQARVLATNPLKLWELESCYPARRAISLGEPVISVGLLGAPLALFVSDPLRLYNFTLMTLCVASALAMFLLVSRWTGSRWAGVVAGLIYGFLPIKLHNPNHPYVHDTLWTVLALYFARDYFSRGRLRSIVLAAICSGIQMGASFYAFLGATLLAMPFIAWLFASYGASRLRPKHLVLAAGIIMLALIIAFAPYLTLAEPHATRTGGLRVFASWLTFTPQGRFFPGYLAVGLMLLGVLVRRQRAMLSRHDPRPALVAGGLLCLLVAMGPNSPLGNIYDLLARVVPGLELVRAPAFMVTAAHLAMSIVVGFGAACLLRSLPSRGMVAAGTLLVVITFLTTFMLGYQGGPAPIVYQPYSARPAQDALDFYRELEKSGPGGPLLDQPVSYRSTIHSRFSPLMLAAYHQRQTFTCYSSYVSTEHQEIVKLSQELDDDAAVDRLIDLGFRTVIARNWNTPAKVRKYAKKLAAQSAAPGSRLRLVLKRPPLFAYELLDPLDR